jgi:hypothetical protein
MFSGKCSCHIFSFLFWELHVSWVVVLTVNPSMYVEIITFCISEWLAGFSFVISFYFLVSYDKAVETITQKGCKVQQRTSCSVGSAHNVIFVIWFLLFLLQFFTVVNKHNVVQVSITCDLDSSVPE